MALKKTPPKQQRLQIAKAWIPTYTGQNIVKGYKKHFALLPLSTFRDLQLLGYEFSSEYIEQLKVDEVNRAKQNIIRKEKATAAQQAFEYDDFESWEEDGLDFIEEYEVIDDDFINTFVDEYESKHPTKLKKFKNHDFIGGRLIQTNKKYSQLKQKQKALIAEWFFFECYNFYQQNGRFIESKNEREMIIDLVYKRIQDRDIWIPSGEIIQYFSKKKGKIKKRVMSQRQGYDFCEGE